MYHHQLVASAAILTALLTSVFVTASQVDVIQETPLQGRGARWARAVAGVQHWQPPSSIKAFNVLANERLSSIFDLGNPDVFSEPASSSTGGQRVVDGVRNALGPGQDPSPLSRIESDGKRHYYFPTIDFGYGVFMQSSTDLNTVLSVKSNEYSVFNYTSQIGPEAPGFFQWDANNYLLYISSVGADGKGYMYVLHNDGQDLLGPWTDLGPVRFANGTALQNYDAFPFVHPNGKRYLMYSALYSVKISELKSFTHVGTHAAETTIEAGNGKRVIEAPGAIVAGSKVNVFWSENGYFSPEYNVLNRAVSVDEDLLDKSTYSSKPTVTVLKSNSDSGVYGPGSAATFTGPDGKPWIALTCFYDPNGFDQTKVNPRRVQAQPLAFNNDDSLRPITPDKPVRYN